MTWKTPSSEPASRQGTFITFEGPDGSGKTTQLGMLAAWLRRHGREPVLLRQPGGTLLGESIRGMLLNSRAEDAVAPLAELALMFADRAQAFREIIEPALTAGQVVLCDRYTDSSEAYQGGGRGLGSERVLCLHRALCDDLQPDLTILLLPDLEAALSRARARNRRQRSLAATDENRFETEDSDFYKRVHQAYRAIAEREPGRVLCIGGDDPIEAVAERVRGIVSQRFPTLVSGM